jgi:hypothetical protein
MPGAAHRERSRAACSDVRAAVDVLRVNRAEHFSKQFDALAAFACPVHKSGHFRADFGVNPRF